MTINEYITNPYGKGSTFANGKTVKATYDADFASLRPQMSLMIYRKGSSIIFHVKIPSKKAKVFYDVVVEVDMNDIPQTDPTIYNAPFKIFSNCPSFIYTYLFAFKMQKMLCEWLNNKYSKEERDRPSNIRNAYGIIGYEKSIYLALCYIKVRYPKLKDALGIAIKSSYSNIATKVLDTKTIKLLYAKSRNENKLVKMQIDEAPIDDTAVPNKYPHMKSKKSISVQHKIGSVKYSKRSAHKLTKSKKIKKI